VWHWVEKIIMNIKHVNHSSLFIKRNEFAILTDPWVHSVAFGGWKQSPGADDKIIKQALEFSGDKCLILISHGHDDHFDDNFIRENFSNSTIAIAKFRSPGVRFRAQSVSDAEVIEVDQSGFNRNGFEIKAYINDKYTGDDAIFIIADKNHFLVHANDNWHIQPKHILSAISKDASAFDGSLIAWCSQVGIAGSWPIYYEQYSFKERTNIIKQALEKMLIGSLKNAVEIGASYLYAYANQSMFINKVEYLQFYQRDVWINSLISKYSDKYPLKIEQLFPGSKLFDKNLSAKENPLFNANITELKSENFDYHENECTGNKLFNVNFAELKSEDLVCFENECNEYLNNKINYKASHVGLYIDGSDRVIQAKAESKWGGELNIVASKDIWVRVLNGSLNIEAMTIGGMCGIYKKDRDQNLRDIHIGLSNFGYKYQAIKNKK